MVLLEKLWDDVLAGPCPEKGLGKLRRKVSTKPLVTSQDGEAKVYKQSKSMPGTSMTPETPPALASAEKKANMWHSIFHPWSNINDLFYKPQPNSSTIYDWMHSGDTRTEHR